MLDTQIRTLTILGTLAEQINSLPDNIRAEFQSALRRSLQELADDIRKLSSDITHEHLVLEECQLIRVGQVVSAIESLKERSGLSISEAKEIVDTFRKERGLWNVKHKGKYEFFRGTGEFRTYLGVFDYYEGRIKCKADRQDNEVYCYVDDYGNECKLDL